LHKQRRLAPVELLSFPAEAAEWIGSDGTITINAADIEIRRWEASQ
jgi:hypothetical protein